MEDLKERVLISVLGVADADCSSSDAYALAAGDVPHAGSVS